jgi:hypothetical protein
MKPNASAPDLFFPLFHAFLAHPTKDLAIAFQIQFLAALTTRASY